jgi:hypothetical protein
VARTGGTYEELVAKFRHFYTEPERLASYETSDEMRDEMRV